MLTTNEITNAVRSAGIDPGGDLDMAASELAAIGDDLAFRGVCEIQCTGVSALGVLTDQALLGWSPEVLPSRIGWSDLEVRFWSDDRVQFTDGDIEIDVIARDVEGVLALASRQPLNAVANSQLDITEPAAAPAPVGAASPISPAAPTKKPPAVARSPFVDDLQVAAPTEPPVVENSAVRQRTSEFAGKPDSGSGFGGPQPKPVDISKVENVSTGRFARSDDEPPSTVVVPPLQAESLVIDQPTKSGGYRWYVALGLVLGLGVGVVLNIDRGEDPVVDPGLGAQLADLDDSDGTATSSVPGAEAGATDEDGTEQDLAPTATSTP